MKRFTRILGAALALNIAMASVGFADTEGITHLGENRFAIVEEGQGTICLLAIDATTTRVTRDQADITEIEDIGGNQGLEGVAYDPKTGSFYVVKEKRPRKVYRVTRAGVVSHPWDAEKMGLRFEGMRLDVEALRQWKASVVDTLSKGVDHLVKKLPANALAAISEIARYISSPPPSRSTSIESDWPRRPEFETCIPPATCTSGYIGHVGGPSRPHRQIDLDTCAAGYNSNGCYCNYACT